MQGIKKQSTAKYVMTAVTICFIAVIFINSLVPGDVSGQISGSILTWINGVFSSIGLPLQMTHYVVRKTAHFTEYFILGVLLLATLRLYREKIKDGIFAVLFTGLSVPVVDETIQRFVDGRGGEIKDVWIDFSGVITGLFICFLISLCILYNKNKKSNHKKGYRYYAR